MPHYHIDPDYTVVRIHCPEWYKREDFRVWLNSSASATWHLKGTLPGDFSDAFTVYDHGEGPDSPNDSTDWPGIPDNIWDAIGKELAARGITVAMLWLDNLEMEG